MSIIKYSCDAILSDIKPFETILLSREQLTDYVFFRKKIEIDKETKFNFALVLGCSDYKMMFLRANAAIELYRQSMIDKIVLTGGIGFISKERSIPEAIIMFNYMRKRGIPDSDIIVEDKSRNTYENILNSYKKILEGQICEGIILVVTQSFHCKRSVGICRNVMSEGFDIMHFEVSDSLHERDNWSRSFIGQRDIRIEALQISRYACSGVMENMPLKIACRKRERK